MRKALLLATLLAGLAIFAAALVACGSGGDDDNGGGDASAQPAAAPAARVTNITVRAGDWFFEPKDLRAPAGTIKVTFQSTGPMFPHTMAVKNLSGEGELFTSDRFENGQTGNFEFTVSQPGTYQLLCVVRGHADRGQTGTLTVTAQ